MAQAANIVLADGQATPVNVTFAVEDVKSGIATFADRSTGIASRFPRLTVRYKGASGTTPAKTSFAVSMPIFGTLPSGAQGVIYTLRGSVNLDLPDGCTDAERKNFYAFIRNGLANTLVQGNMRDYDPLY